MSVWTKMKSKVLEEKVDMEYFQEAIKSLDMTLDFSQKEIGNAYGKEKVDAMIKVKGKKTALGIVLNRKGGLDITGDTWGSGIVRDKEHTKLANMMAQTYQAYKTKKQLEIAAFDVVEVKKDGKIILECTQW